MRRLAITLLSIWIAPASAQQAPPDRAGDFQVGRWYGKPFYDPGAAIFTHCSAHTPMSGGTSVAFVMNRHRDFSIVFGNPFWSLDIGETWDTGIFDEGAENEGLIARAIDANLVAIQFGNDPDRYRPLIAWGELVAPLPGGVARFVMPEGGVALQALTECVAEGQRYNVELRRHTAAVAQPAAPDERAPSVARQRPACAPPDLRAVVDPTAGGPATDGENATSGDDGPDPLLTRLMLDYLLETARIGNVEVLPESFVAGQFGAADAAWISGNVLGFAARLSVVEADAVPAMERFRGGVACPNEIEIVARPRTSETPSRRWMAACRTETAGIAYRTTALERPFETVIVTHCAEDRHIEELDWIDGAVTGAMDRLSGGWGAGPGG